MAKSVANKKKKDCCGCNACAEICPKHCIEMKEDKKGFFYPSVNNDLCVGCGLCQKVCPFVNEHNKLILPKVAYAAWNKDEKTYLNSSSGGVAYVLSKLILEKNGVVYGCTSNGLDVSHIRVDNVCELYKLQGSKYVQSDIRGVFSQVKRDIEGLIPVLFIGTPCQVAGLKNYIKNIPDNLYLVDIICHGVPSQRMLRQHVKFVMGKCEIRSISFRIGANYIFRILSNDGRYYESKFWKDLYYKAFIDGISCRPSCSNCPFACEKRGGDITIGDFWGLNDANKFPIKIDNGISVVLPCTDKGLNILKETRSFLALYIRTVDEAVSGNAQLHHPLKSYRSRAFGFFYSFLPFDMSVFLSIWDKKVFSFMKIIFLKCKNGFRR